MRIAPISLLLLAACTQTPAPQASPSSSTSPSPSPSTPPPTIASASAAALPDYLARMESLGEHYVRPAERADYTKSPFEDVEVLRLYPRLPNKGALTGPAAERLTIMTRKTVYAPNEEIRVLHVHEATQPGVSIFVMGPKAIYGEYVDGRLASRATEAPPDAYDGVVLPSPNVDHNYDTSIHKLPAGKHILQWKFKTLSGSYLESNVLTIEVR